jgi:hypothetical protein
MLLIFLTADALQYTGQLNLDRTHCLVTGYLWNRMA